MLSCPALLKTGCLYHWGVEKCATSSPFAMITGICDFVDKNLRQSSVRHHPCFGVPEQGTHCGAPHSLECSAHNSAGLARVQSREHEHAEEHRSSLAKDSPPCDKASPLGLQSRRTVRQYPVRYSTSELSISSEALVALAAAVHQDQDDGG